MTLSAYPVADIFLARRLEAAEGRTNVEFVRARQATFPDALSASATIADTYVIFDGVASPLTQTFGMGLLQQITADELGEIETFFQRLGANVFHEVWWQLVTPPDGSLKGPTPPAAS